MEQDHYCGVSCYRVVGLSVFEEEEEGEFEDDRAELGRAGVRGEAREGQDGT